MAKSNLLHRIYAFLWQNHTLSQTVLKNTFWLGVSQIVGRLIRATIVIYAARVLGVANYGVFSYALAIIGFAAIFYDLGINGILTREATKNSAQRLNYLSNALLIKATLIIVLALIVSLGVPRFINNIDVIPILQIVVWLFVFNGLRDFCLAYIRSLEKMEYEAGINIVVNVSLVVLAWIMLLKGATPENLAIAYAASSGIGLVVAIGIIMRHLANPFRYYSYDLVKKIMMSAWPFALIGFFSAFLVYADSLMLGWMRSATDVGLYAAAQRPIQLLWAIPYIIAFSVFPVMSRLTKESGQKFGSVFKQALSATLLLALPLTMGSWIMGPQIIHFLYGNDYISSVMTFQILSISFIALFPAVIINYAIFAYDYQKKFIVYSVIGAVLNIILNLFMITKYGATGAAASTIISQIVTYSLMYLAVRKLIWRDITPQITKPLVATIITGVILWQLQQFNPQIYWSILIVLITYPALLIILKDQTVFKLKHIVADVNYHKSG
ncbi:MAG: flippase [Patescibacteria group bacterium]|jgi:O-antigen/teichoic acid export membrane protein